MPSRKPIVEFLKLEREKTRELEALLRLASRDIGDQLAAGGTSKVTALQLRAQQAAIRSYLNGSFDDIGKLIREGQSEAARRASGVVSDEFDKLFKFMSEDELTALRAAEATRASNGVVAAMRRLDSSYVPLSRQVYRTRALATGSVDRLVNLALIQGHSWQQLAKAVRSSIDPSTPGGVSYAAKRLARTEINNAFHAASVARYQESGIVDEVDWNLSGSHPEGDECDDLKKDGPYPVTKVPSKPHPHCFCYVTAALPEPDQFLENLFAGKYDDSGSANSPTVKELRSAAKE